MHKYWMPFFSPDDNTGIGLAPKPEVADEDTELLDKLLDNKPEKEEVELEEPELEIEEKPEEVEEEPDELLVESNRALDLKKIKEKYPDFAKTNEFRELRNAYHREAQYTELFPTVEDAREAAEDKVTYDKLNDALINRGDVGTLLSAIKEASPQSLKKVTTTFLDSVASIDPQLYTETISPVIKRLARAIGNDAKKMLARNKDSEDGNALLATARNIMQFAFEDPELIDKDDPKPDPAISQKEQEISQREQVIRINQFQGAYGIANNSVEKNLDKYILDGLDPDNRFNEFTRDTLLERIKNDVKNQISADQTHLRRMNSLWKRAEEEGYSRDSLSRIVSAYLERARAIIPASRTKFRTKAVGSRQQLEQDTDNVRIARKGTTGRAPERDGRSPKVADPKKIDYRKTTDDDIFEGKLSLK